MPADVLIIEDSLSQGLRLKLLLERQNLKVDLVDRGQEGMAMAVLQLPAVVVLDANLPDIDGQHICRALKDHPATMEIPVVLLLTQGQDRATPTVVDASADVYIPKDDAAESNLLQALRDLGILKRQELPHVLGGRAATAGALPGGSDASNGDTSRPF